MALAEVPRSARRWCALMRTGGARAQPRPDGRSSAIRRAASRYYHKTSWRHRTTCRASAMGVLALATGRTQQEIAAADAASPLACKGARPNQVGAAISRHTARVGGGKHGLRQNFRCGNAERSVFSRCANSAMGSSTPRNRQKRGNPPTACAAVTKSAFHPKPAKPEPNRLIRTHFTLGRTGYFWMICRSTSARIFPQRGCKLNEPNGFGAITARP
jgi:hypothetical protein